MNNILMIFLIAFSIIILILMIIILIKVSKKDNTKLENDMRYYNDQLNQNMNNMSNFLNNTINSLKDNTFDKLSNLTNSITRVDEAQNGLKGLSNNIEQLTRVLTDKKTRGNYGEGELYSILTSIYGEQNTFWKKQYSFENNGVHVIADAVIFGFSKNQILCVDSKFPMENYLKMIDNSLNDQDRTKATSDFKNNVKKHIDDISSKYIVDGFTADCALMFLPSESMYVQIFNSFQDLVNYSYDKHVILTSPTSLVAYLSAIKNMYLQFKKEQNINNIIIELKKLSDEFGRFSTRNAQLYNDLAKFGKSFKDVNITADKITKAFERINSLETNNDESK